jgi:hypothetical protein
MLDADYLRRQAEVCVNLSRATFDLVIAHRLRTMAEEFRRHADAIADLDERMPSPVGGTARPTAR